MCVTAQNEIDAFIELAKLDDVIIATFGDLIRVPGTDSSLQNEQAKGRDVRVVYSTFEAIDIAKKNPDKNVVFLGVGFETTAPANAMSVFQARNLGLKNYSVLVSHVRVPPAMHAVLSSPHNRVQGFLAAGHVCAVMGYWEYPAIANKYQTPIVVTGFEPLDIAKGILETVKLLETGQNEVRNAYPRAVVFEGNQPAQKVIRQIFQDCDRKWRGIGAIPMSGWCLQSDFESFDAEKKFDVESIQPDEPTICIAGQILQGLKKPIDCEAFGNLCKPESPLGATMVSAEGACAAYYKYGRGL